jgi:hypothetical protein
VDMPAMSVASVAPARHRNRKGGFFKSISTDLATAEREKGGFSSDETSRRREGAQLSVSDAFTQGA